MTLPMTLSSAIALAKILPSAVALAMVLPSAMTVVMAIYIALADATTVVIVHPYQEKNLNICFCSWFGYGNYFVHSSGYGYG